VRTSTNPTGPEVNDHVSLQWPSYEQPQGSNLRLQRKQTSWFQSFITGLSPRWLLSFPFLIVDVELGNAGRPREALHVEANTQEEASGVSSCS